MAKSLTDLISATQALLLDDGTRFTTPTITAACRSALRDFNMLAPIFGGTLVDVVKNQKEYALNSADFVDLIEVMNVLKQGTDTFLEDNTDLDFHAFFEDNQPFIRLHEAQTSGFLIVRFTLPYTVNGLDSKVESTIPAYFDNVLVDGCCFYSCLIRSAGRIESINLNQNVTKSLQDAMQYYRQAFIFGLGQAARRQPPLFNKNIEPEETTTDWNDKFHAQSWDA